MTASHPIVDASPLIAPSRIGRLELLEQRYRRVLLPQAVAVEVGPLLASQPWLAVVAPAAVDARIRAANLGPGESEVIALALESPGSVVILDDEQARRLAKALWVPMIGAVGILVAAKSQGHVPLVRPWLDALPDKSVSRLHRALRAGHQERGRIHVGSPEPADS